jgi:hypothetical protein
MEANGKIGSNGVYVSDNIGKRFETDIYIKKIYPIDNKNY